MNRLVEVVLDERAPDDLRRAAWQRAVTDLPEACETVLEADDSIVERQRLLAPVREFWHGQVHGVLAGKRMY